MEAPVAANSDSRRIIPSVPEGSVLDENYRPIEKGESFPGGMPILLRGDKARFDQQAESLYDGDGVGHGKWGDVYLSGEKATKVFKWPNNILNAYDLEFIKKYGGVAGLPRFIGVIPNGYQMERFRGESLQKLIDVESDKDYYTRRFTTKEILQRVLSREQAQELLDRIAEFHRGTGRVHGDLGHWDDVIVGPDGRIRLIDPEWERIGGVTPKEELESTYGYLTEEGGFSGLVLPETISDEEAEENLKRFEQEVNRKVEMDSVIGGMVAKYKDQQVDVKIREDGTVLVKRMSV